jgi:hypothetical protein
MNGKPGTVCRANFLGRFATKTLRSKSQRDSIPSLRRWRSLWTPLFVIEHLPVFLVKLAKN